MLVKLLGFGKSHKVPLDLDKTCAKLWPSYLITHTTDFTVKNFVNLNSRTPYQFCVNSFVLISMYID